MKPLLLILAFPFSLFAADGGELKATLQQIQQRAQRIEERAKAAESDRAAALKHIAEVETANANLSQSVDKLDGEIAGLREWGIEQQSARHTAEAKAAKLAKEVQTVTKERDEARAHVLRIKMALAALATGAAGMFGLYFFGRLGPWGWAAAAGIGLAAGGLVMVLL